jgi:type II secretory pathway predicted ATPase ExeA
MIKKLKNFFGLRKIPFSKNIASNELYQSRSLTDITSRLEFALENEDFFLISGSAGSGKSTSLRYAVSQSDPQVYPSVYITAENYKIGDIAKLFLSGLNVEAPYNGYKALNLIKKTADKMSKEKNQKPILIIDEAQELPISTYVSIKNLTNFNMDSESRILIILCGQLEMLAKIKSASLESLRRRIRLHYKIEALSIEECAQYINYQMKLAGIDRKIFPDEITAEIFKISKGNICNINNICFELLIQAAINSKEIIEHSLLDKIILPA